MKIKLLAIAGSLISLVMTACGKPETPSATDTNTNQQIDSQTVQSATDTNTNQIQQNNETNDSAPVQQTNPQDDDDITVEEYANNIIEYEEFDVSYNHCSKYGPRPPTLYDVCNNQLPSSHCSYHATIRYLKDNPDQCEYISNKRVGDCNKEVVESERNSKYSKKENSEVRKQKYAVSTEEMDISVRYCDKTDNQNKKKTVRSDVKKVCPVANNVVDSTCKCYIVKDNCGNYFDDNGKIVYVTNNKAVRAMKPDDCQGHVGEQVGCAYPEVTEYGPIRRDPSKPTTDIFSDKPGLIQ